MEVYIPKRLNLSEFIRRYPPERIDRFNLDKLAYIIYSLTVKTLHEDKPSGIWVGGRFFAGAFPNHE